MAKKPQYPNPKFFKAKDNIDWKKQGENLMTCMKIFAEMFKETDWNRFFEGQKNNAIAFADRVKEEYAAFMALDAANKKDVILNGERRLGRLYRKGAMATVRREWRGIKDTAYDFYEWARMWVMLLMTFSKDLIPAMNSALHYRWMISYFCCHGFMDKNIMGLRGSNLRMSHILIYDIFRYVAENLVFLSKADRKNGNSTELNKMLVTFDEMTMGQIMAGFPDLLGIPHQLLPVFLVSEIDQLTCVPYIDAVESFGLPADCCPVPSSECGALVIDALPDMGSGFISSSMPCDGSTMASSYFSRRFPNTPVFHLCFPVRYEDETVLQSAAEDIKACIKFIEDQTGAKWNWDAYFAAMKRFNLETSYELQKWEINKTPYPQLLGPVYELFRKWNYEMDGGIDPRVIGTCEKVNKILLEAYEKREEAWPGKMKYRAIVWSCPAHYYANFSNWAANCWGINVLVEMESLNFTKPLETEDKEEALRDLARLYERMVMRRHTNGGYHNVVTELWRQCEDWNAKLIIMYQNVACKNMATVQGLLDDQGRERGYDLIWIEHDLMDPRTVSRRTMRDKVNEYMRTVMNAEPIDPSLVEFEDEVCM
ncbi:2-hydroxyglutaryl-CoA dehydratase D-component HgdA1 [Firmicutes bacterium CAG:555]|nr:2-hydroxyglutaryl-CoA dehydratase D-component HgdA1 [Firmicutes bacterium CAG:555]